MLLLPIVIADPNGEDITKLKTFQPMEDIDDSNMKTMFDKLVWNSSVHTT